MDSPGIAKWWHVADKELENFVANVAGVDSLAKLAGLPQETAYGCAVGTMAAKPPRPRVSNSPRPHVTPGTPLMTHRSTPRPTSARRARPLSARRSSEPFTPRLQRSDSQPKDGKISVHVYNMHSSDKLIFRVHPDQRVGIGGPMPELSQEDAANLPSFKCEIARILGIDKLTIRLMFRGCPLSSEEKTLSCYGIADGDVVHLRIASIPSAGRDDVMLACAAKKRVQESEWAKDEMLFMRPYAMQSPSSRNRLQNRCEQNGVALQPKWVSQDNPKLFARVGAGMDGHGNDSPFEDFSMQGIWHSPVDHPNQRGQNQYGLQRVRESIMGRRPSVGGA